VPACLARAKDLKLASENEHEAAPVGLSNRNGKFCTMNHERCRETWLPARQAGQGSGRVDDGSTNFKSCVPAGRAGEGRKSGRAVPVIEFMEQKTPQQKIHVRWAFLPVDPRSDKKVQPTF